MLGNSGFGNSTYSGCPGPTTTNPPCGPASGFVGPRLSVQQMLEILADSVFVAGDSLAQNRIWHNRRFLWERILMDTLYPTAPVSVQAFYNANQTMGIGMLAKTDIALSQMNTTAALSQNSFVPANNYEAKQQQVNAVKIKLADTTGSMPVINADISTLKNIANGCPDSYGKAFYEARSVLNLLYGQELHYGSHCADGNSYRLAETEGLSETEVLPSANVSLYPNPNSGSFTLSYTIEHDATLYIYDMQGKQVYSLPLVAEQKSVVINNLDLQNGAYMYKVQNTSATLSNGKLIILK